MPRGGPVATQLADVQSQFQAISDRADRIVAAVGNDLIAVRPRSTAWSIAECLTHLTLTADAYLPIWRHACRDARARGVVADSPFMLDRWGRFFVWFLEPPPKLRFRAPRRFHPVTSGPPDRVLCSFLASQARILEMMQEAEGLPLDRITIGSAFNHRVRYSIWSSFCANAAHHRRHLWQAERVADALGRDQ